ncbi:MAG: DNA mismatch endonuclease Vsr [Candidatus Aminicenantes bacterium]|nr:DNA mismatch endonuclease Vsr [Candidatus Aminicenantes bacterium]
MDIYSKKKRSEIMSKISGKDTKPEVYTRKFLFSKGFRYRVNDKRYQGKPDIVLPKFKTMVFIHGCFWHGHTGCKASELPETRKQFWRKKILDTKSRDKRNIEALKKGGWNIIVIWQCEIKNKTKRQKRLHSLVTEILKNSLSYS